MTDETILEGPHIDLVDSIAACCERDEVIILYGLDPMVQIYLTDSMLGQLTQLRRLIRKRLRERKDSEKREQERRRDSWPKEGVTLDGRAVEPGSGRTVGRVHITGLRPMSDLDPDSD